MSKAYPPEFHKRVLDRLDAGHSVSEIAHDLGITAQSIYNWRNQHLIDTGQRDGITSTDHVELVAARKRIAALEADLAASQLELPRSDGHGVSVDQAAGLAA